MERFKSSFKTLQQALSTSLRFQPPPLDNSSAAGCSDAGGRPNSRLFFSPCSTKSIMDEHQFKLETRKKKNKKKKKKKAAAASSSSPAACSPRTVSTAEPFREFRASMEEMVAAHRIRHDRRSLEELLHCYLQLNERRHHKLIALAFVDLLMHLNHLPEKDDDRGIIN